MGRIIRHAIFAAFMLLACLASSASASTLVFTNFTVPGALTTVAMGVNSSGLVVGYYSTDKDTDQQTHGFVKKGDELVSFDVPGSNASTVAMAINDKGVVVGYYADDKGGPHAFLLNVEDVFADALSKENVTEIPAPEGTSGVYGGGLNDYSDVAGVYQKADTGDTDYGFLQIGGKPVLFQNPEAPDGKGQTLILGINNKGVVAGTFATQVDGQLSVHGFTSQPDGSDFQVVDHPKADGGTQVYRINDGGMLAGTYITGTFGEGAMHGFLTDGASYSSIDDPDSPEGAVANRHVLIYDQVRGTLVFGLNNIGTMLAGGYAGKDGLVHAFTAEFVEDVPTSTPEPGPAMLLGGGLLALVGLRRRVRG